MMNIFCMIGRHEAIPSDLWNEGLYFSKCRRCDQDLIKSTGNWRTIPRGHRIVWRKREEAPFLNEAEKLPAIPARRGTAVVALRRHLMGDRRDDDESEAFPVLLAAIALIAAGLSLFFRPSQLSRR